MQRFYWNDDWYLTEKQDEELVKYERRRERNYCTEREEQKT